VIAPLFPQSCQLYASDGRYECCISSGDAKRLVKRQIAEIVMDGPNIIGIIRISRVVEVGALRGGMPQPKKFHRRQDLGGCWVWQLVDLEGRAVA
jgi:hypothetical protein